MLYLIILDIFWFSAALWVDYPKLITIPIWAWAFVVICPIYPFLLAIIWWQKYGGKKPNQYILSFASIPAAILGVLALIYYPLIMQTIGFNLNDFGQIFWVLFYSAQGWYLLFYEKFQNLPVIIVLIYLFTKFTIDYMTKTFGYLEVGRLNGTAFFTIFIVATCLTVAISLVILRKKRINS